ncbi:hypothetical protein ACIQXU_16675 [Peribacillus sp. NPDC097284]|uniref:hypothetical protein n=1 Tax=Peribacillus sp. NPDC097284 TaxID=3364401 RepID=UPI00380A41CB
MSIKSQDVWKVNVGQPYYINVPRFSMLAADLNVPLNEFEELSGKGRLKDLGIELHKLILSFRSIVNRIKPKTLSFRNLQFDDIKHGLLIEFNDRFNSKNSRKLRESQYDHDREPHLWKVYEDYKVIMTMNPKWVTTETAISSLSRNAEFAGLCLVKQIDSEQKIVYATPLFIGIPRDLDFFEAFRGY